MERNTLTSNQAARIQALTSALVARAELAAKLGSSSYEGDRNLYQALGYPLTLEFKDFAARYMRQDIAKAIIDRPANATWQGPLFLQESSEAEETDLEREWKILDKKLKLKSTFNRVDKLAGIGRYGVLLLGLDDVSSREDWAKPVKKGVRKLLYVKPFGEKAAKIHTVEDKPNNERYGLPLLYEITTTDVTNGTTTTSYTVNVHHSRVIHIVDDVLENEVLGAPKLEVVYNRLMDLEKIVGGDSEMFWRSARPGFQGIVDKDYQLSDPMKEDLKEQIDEYEHNLRRMLLNEGIKYEALEQQVSDPTSHVDVQLQMISAVTGIPKRILTGTERGELSSNQDASEWRSYVNGRRLDHAEPHIVRPFVDRMIEYGILPDVVDEDEDYTVEWSDLYALSEADNVKLGLDRSNALRNYVSSPMAESVLSPEAFLEYCMGFNDNQIAIVKEMSDSEIINETAAIMKKILPPQPVEGNPVNKGAKQPMRRMTPPSKKNPNRTQKGIK